MESFFTRFKNVLVLVVVLLAQTIGLAIQIRRPAEVGAPDEEESDADALLGCSCDRAIRAFFMASVTTCAMAGQTTSTCARTRQENHALKDEVARLRLEQAQLSEDALQGHRLQTLLNFQRSYVSSTVAAQVIGSSGTDRLPRSIYR